MIKPINRNDPYYKAFVQQRHNAARRRIEWKFDYWTYRTWWEDSGVFHLRGKGTGKYVMSRVGDTGPYSIDNVYPNLYENNTRDAAFKAHKNRAGELV
jgi:hypothetical protein